MRDEPLMVCMVPKCKRTVRCRGMCDIHYTYTAMLVKKGQYTWEKLVKDGKCLPLKNKRSHSKIREWLDSKPPEGGTSEN